MALQYDPADFDLSLCGLFGAHLAYSNHEADASFRPPTPNKPAYEDIDAMYPEADALETRRAACEVAEAAANLEPPTPQPLVGGEEEVMPVPAPPVATLPVELLQVILAFLAHADALSFRQVCQRFCFVSEVRFKMLVARYTPRQFVGSFPIQYTPARSWVSPVELIYGDHPAKALEPGLAWFDRRNPRLERVELTGCPGNPDSNIAAVARAVPRVPAIWYDDACVTNAGAIALAAVCRGLTELSLDYTFVGDDGLAAILHGCTHLTSLRLTGTPVTGAAAGQHDGHFVVCPSLTTLVLNGSFLNDRGCKVLSSCLPNLKRLEINETDVSDIGVDALLGNCDQLAVLSVMAASGVTEPGLRAAGLKSKSLRTLMTLHWTNTEITEVADEWTFHRFGVGRRGEHGIVVITPNEWVLPTNRFEWEEDGHRARLAAFAREALTQYTHCITWSEIKTVSPCPAVPPPSKSRCSLGGGILAGVDSHRDSSNLADLCPGRCIAQEQAAACTVPGVGTRRGAGLSSRRSGGRREGEPRESPSAGLSEEDARVESIGAQDASNVAFGTESSSSPGATS